MQSSNCDPWTFFGTWSLKDKEVLSGVLQKLGVIFNVTESVEDEQSLRQGYAWDPFAPSPNVGYHVWVHDDDVGKIDNEIKERFPGRKYID